MKNHTHIHSVLGAALLLSTTLTACPGGGDDTDSATGTATTTNTTSTTDAMTMGTTDEPTTAGTTTNTPTTGPTTGTTTATTGNTTGDDGFVFPTDPFDAYVQIDRHGAVEAGTAGIRAAEGLGFNPGSDISLRDDYNASNPADDAMGMWLSEISNSVMFFHDALDDDLMGLGLTPATLDVSLMQAGPVIVPDTIKYNPMMPAGYPNGRRLEDQVVDITLAAVLLELGPMQPLTTFADLPLNPVENDVPFQAEFPFLAPPHAP